MNTRIETLKGILNRDQRGITGLETAIVLIAFVVVASVFAFAVITTGLFSSEEAASSAQAGVESAKSTMTPKGSMILAEAISTGTATAAAATMTDAGAGFVVEGVKVGDTIRNVTDGSSSTLTVVAATVLTGVLTGGTNNTWAIGDVYEVDMDSVSTIKFKVTPSPGAEPFSLASDTTLVSFNDSNNNQNGTYLATIPFGGGADPFATANTAYWTHNWVVGSGPGIDTGDVVEFTVNIKNFTTPLTANSSFSVEIVPQTGSALAVSRTTPLEMAKVMDLN
ncbi:MAG: hypothetical protein H8E48_14945 [Chloroflexi bacterium]|nr:hypothetical protein [Chloroflexota bacterium]